MDIRQKANSPELKNIEITVKSKQAQKKRSEALSPMKTDTNTIHVKVAFYHRDVHCGDYFITEENRNNLNELLNTHFGSAWKSADFLIS